MQDASGGSGDRFGYLWVGHSVNVAGSALAPVALTLGLIDRGEDPRVLAVALAAGAVPAVVGFGLVHRLAGRVGPRTQAVFACLLGAVSQLGLALVFALGTLHLGLLVPCALGTGLAAALYFPAVPRLVRAHADRDALQAANARISLSRSVAGTIGPAAGAALTVAAGATAAIAIDGVSFLVAAVLLARLPRISPARHSARAATAPTATTATAPRTKLRDLLRRPWVWSSLAVFMVGNLVAPVFYIAGPLLVADDDTGFVEWGVILALVGAGAVLGDLAMMRVTPGRPLIASRIVELGITPVMVLVAVSAPSLALLAAAALSGAAKAIPDTLWFTALQERLDDASLAAVTSFDWMISIGLRPLGYLAAVPLISLVGEAHTLLVCSAVMVAACLLSLLPRDVRSFRSDPARDAAGVGTTG